MLEQEYPLKIETPKSQLITELQNVLSLSDCTCIVGNPIPTRKLAHQLTRTAMDIAAGRGPCENSSAVIIHGIDPGPTAKKTT